MIGRLREILGRRPAIAEAMCYAAVAAGAAALFLPALGRDGLWDPWETHYAEVARRMVVDGDWIVLRWHDEMFYSKPVFLFWIVALSFEVLGVSDLAARLPVALFAIAGIVLVYHFARLLWGRLEAACAAACLATMPLFAFIARQNITDMPFVISMTVGVLGLMRRLQAREGGLPSALVGYAFMGIATLSKGVLGFALPGAVVLVYVILTQRWALLKRIALLPGIGVFLLVTLPWYVAISVKQGGAFLYEFFYLHHLARASGGVHGERGTFEYFIGQGGYAVLTWLPILPAALARLGRRIGAAFDPDDGEAGRDLFLAVWIACSLALFTISRTKFHHYVFPALPPLAIAAGAWLPAAIRGGLPRAEKVLLACGSALAVLVARDLVLDTNRLSRLFTYAYERPLPEAAGMAWICASVAALAIAGAACVAMLRRPSGRAAGAAVLLGAGTAFVLLLEHHMMPRVSLDIGQAESFAIWNGRDEQPGDRFYNWKMNWRGEIFQSRDTIGKVSRLDEFRRLASEEGRLFLITTRERFLQLDQEVVRMRGRPLERLNPHDMRYVMSLWDGPAIEPRPPEPYVEALPEAAIPVHATLGGGAMELVGYRIDAREVDLGGSFVMTLWWRALEDVKESYLVFLHGERPLAGEVKRFNGNHMTGEGLHGTDAWVPGRLLEDTFSVCVDYGIPLGTYSLSAGLYKDKDRVHFDDPALHDGHDRHALGEIAVVWRGPGPEPGL